ncbi:hypothetical protein RGQ13_08600 [Thalassotalea psychrophila]|uniref:Integrase n=1 Tax=Thalassotalea psychrophila TaxID=3065647 RepID=A0ABY9U0F9_9GAMM|nr:hypothetical protein RGQ13_08600 [Colwelliaceae bacterium SQ149]
MVAIRQLKSDNWNAQIRIKGTKPYQKTFKNEEDAIEWANLE